MAQSPLAQLDNAFPRFNGNESVEQKIDQLTSYIYQQNEIIRYLLNHIGVDNMTNDAIKTITDPVRVQISDVEKGLSTKIDVTAEGISTEVAAVKSTADGNTSSISTLNQRATTIEANVTTAQQTADGAASVANAASSLATSADGTAASAMTKVNSITTTSGGVTKVKTASLDIVASSSGSYVTLQGDKINLNGAVNVSDPSSSLAGSVKFGQYTMISSTAGEVADLSLSTSGAINLTGSNGGLVLDNDGELYGTSLPTSNLTTGRIFFKI